MMPRKIIDAKNDMCCRVYSSIRFSWLRLPSRERFRFRNKLIGAVG